MRFLKPFVIEPHYTFCLIIKVSLNVAAHATPAAFRSSMCDLLNWSIQKEGIKQSFFYSLSAAAVGICEPRWGGGAH